MLGIDIVESHLELARRRYGELAGRLQFANESIFELSAPDRSFDVTVCRHVLHAVPFADRYLPARARDAQRWLPAPHS